MKIHFNDPLVCSTHKLYYTLKNDCKHCWISFHYPPVYNAMAFQPAVCVCPNLSVPSERKCRTSGQAYHLLWLIRANRKLGAWRYTCGCVPIGFWSVLLTVSMKHWDRELSKGQSRVDLYKQKLCEVVRYEPKAKKRMCNKIKSFHLGYSGSYGTFNMYSFNL